MPALHIPPVRKSSSFHLALHWCLPLRATLKTAPVPQFKLSASLLRQTTSTTTGRSSYRFVRSSSFFVQTAHADDGKCRPGLQKQCACNRAPITTAIQRVAVAPMRFLACNASSAWAASLSIKVLVMVLRGAVAAHCKCE